VTPAEAAIAVARPPGRHVGCVGDDEPGRERPAHPDDVAAARTAGGKVVPNPAPVPALLSALLGDVDVLVPNRVVPGP
jgi:hypothetical protein